MANSEHIAKLIEEGVEAWNKWREENPTVKPDLRSANLREADLREANLFKANLISAGLRRANLREANLSRANLIGANLSGANLREADLIWADLIRANLIGANLSGANLIGANLSGADLIGVNLSGADLIEANLIGANLKDANITGANLYGTARDDWKINGIKCDYLFWDQEGVNRIPKDEHFETGEFEELYKQLPTIEYVFEKGFTPVDAFVMDQVVQAINKKHPEFELSLDSFHSRVKPRAVFTVLHQKHADEAINQIKVNYERKINDLYEALEGERSRFDKLVTKLVEEPRIAIRVLEMGDKYEIKGQVGAVGPGAHAHDMSFNQLWQKASSEIDLIKLAEELEQLRLELRKEATTPEHDASIGEIAAAELAAKDDKGPKALEHLKKAGKWTLVVAEKIGTTVAATALKTALGF
jgi:hypothetical protein